MYPIVAEFSFLGIPLTLTSYGLCATVGFICALVAIRHLASWAGVTQVDALFASLFALVTGLMGAKLLFVLVNLPQVGFSQVDALLNGGGFVFYGGFFTGALSIALYARHIQLSLLAFTDVLTPALALGHGFGRIGCFLWGCCYGVPTSLPLGVSYPASPYFFGPSETLLHPVQLYEAAFEFLIAAILAWILKNDAARKEKLPREERSSSTHSSRGKITFIWATCYGLVRLVLELFFRGDERGVGTDVFPPSAWASVLLLGASGIFWAKHGRRIWGNSLRVTAQN